MGVTVGKSWIYWTSIVLLLWLQTTFALECAYYNASECSSPGGCNGESKRTTTCTAPDPATFSCFTVWKRNPEASNQISVQFMGCFLNAKECAGVDTCVDGNYHSNRFPKNSSLHIHFCCCDKDDCNREYVWEPKPTMPPVKQEIVETGRDSRVQLWIWFGGFMVAFAMFCLLVAAFLHRRVQSKPPPTSTSNLTDEENILLDKSESNNLLSPVSLVEMKATGRFGSVWKASMNGHPDWVAVKILPLREKTSWRLEQEVYSLPLMCDSKLVLGYFGARSDADNMQLWLISEYIHTGSLYDYLKGHELSWADVLKISMTMCQGLAFLHDEIDAGVKGVKPAVAHRDFKSKNVLLRADLTACIADFGLADIFYPSKLVGTNHGQVGTRRYMAPEVLDGAVSFTRDNFQRIDMYACGLVLWELVSRCSAQQGPIGEYRLPFEEYVGQQPTLEEMIECVVSQRKRPTIQKDWNLHQGLSVLCDAIKDAWDQDAEARISASCIVERLSSISNRFM